jgi:Protein of unknown function (DUF4230)
MTKRSGILLFGGIGALVLIGSGVVLFYVLVLRPPMELAHNTAEGFRQFFNFTPQVKINEVVVIEQATPIAELATVSRKVFVETDWSHTWLHSTKRIVLRGVYTAKAGFDLREPFTVVIEKNPLRVTTRMPRAKILSLELNDYHVVKDEDGWWNRISSHDRENAVLQMQQEAYAKAFSAGILKESEESIQQRIREIIEKNGSDVTFQLAPSGHGSDSP